MQCVCVVGVSVCQATWGSTVSRTTMTVWRTSVSMGLSVWTPSTVTRVSARMVSGNTHTIVPTPIPIPTPIHTPTLILTHILMPILTLILTPIPIPTTLLTPILTLIPTPILTPIPTLIPRNILTPIPTPILTPAQSN